MLVATRCPVDGKYTAVVEVETNRQRNQAEWVRKVEDLQEYGFEIFEPTQALASELRKKLTKAQGIALEAIDRGESAWNHQDRVRRALAKVGCLSDSYHARVSTLGHMVAEEIRKAAKTSRRLYPIEVPGRYSCQIEKDNLTDWTIKLQRGKWSVEWEFKTREAAQEAAEGLRRQLVALEPYECQSVRTSFWERSDGKGIDASLKVGGKSYGQERLRAELCSGGVRIVLKIRGDVEISELEGLPAGKLGTGYQGLRFEPYDHGVETWVELLNHRLSKRRLWNLYDREGEAQGAHIYAVDQEEATRVALDRLGPDFLQLPEGWEVAVDKYA